MASQRSQRVILPGADEMSFRSAESAEPESVPRAAHQDPPPEQPAQTTSASSVSAPTAAAPGRSHQTRVAKPRAPEPSGRQRHDEKITVYVSAPELLALEQTRLTLRADHGLAADRGRIVREAVGVLLADFAEHGESSLLVRRLLKE
ncbi:hypothetical protein F4561_001879 [Lipingzhangella halophila]|uniref:Cobyrinic acid a,c-diamide synthase n=1 Tax=Lipingzhangella halophila TaxID=1783352 RepID=A0A7W7RFK9_9ACTN|nr:hypothetical protein [Lipingzhangella halophila]MBB4931059.1 hypothetical protein [Lipingzhangella halophila]